MAQQNQVHYITPVIEEEEGKKLLAWYRRKVAPYSDISDIEAAAKRGDWQYIENQFLEDKPNF